MGSSPTSSINQLFDMTVLAFIFLGVNSGFPSKGRSRLRLPARSPCGFPGDMVPCTVAQRGHPGNHIMWRS